MSIENPIGRGGDIDRHPAVACWFCECTHALRAMLADSILISRAMEAGGPYVLFTCHYCLKVSMLEETPRGRWFGSPNVKLGLMDYLFARDRAGSTGDGGFSGKSDHQDGTALDSETVLKAVSWFRENEERRRYFFERDGDLRYSRSNFLKNLWPWGKEIPHREKTRTRPQAQTGSRDHAAKTPRDAPRSPRIVTPHEILGLDTGATREDIQRQFHRLAVRYHPDKVHHLGKDFQVEAHRRFVELQRAYQALIEMRRQGS